METVFLATLELIFADLVSYGSFHGQNFLALRRATE